MRGKLLFLGGIAAGFILGARSGRETYDGMVRTARKVKESPTVQEAAGVIQEQATRLYSDGKRRIAESRIGESQLYKRFFSPNGARHHEETSGGSHAAAPGGGTSYMTEVTTPGSGRSEPLSPESSLGGLPTEGLAPPQAGNSSTAMS